MRDEEDWDDWEVGGGGEKEEVKENFESDGAGRVEAGNGTVHVVIAHD